ncbi:hypothetical protein OHA18_02440 [Kribbella sp. NBC_00709]|uniref:DUF222 domain-containing protein n=1 Tax=Kribbella sp. NBC_00709 TaxID=2975972 RepID=UPI002E2C301C|nr:hypothetical protein [Kribbella sp. NBC_00709]
MFEGDLSELPTADLLESAAEYRAVADRADARLIEVALVYADRYHPSAHPGRADRLPCDGRERVVVLGGEGCPEILEFAIAEFAVMLGLSAGVAADYLGQALALRHRFPFTWARVLAGEATPWKARRIVTDCAKLSKEAAAYVDKRVARLVDSIRPYRLNKIVKAAKMHADADQARAEAAEKARERGVFVGQANEHGTKTMVIKAAAGAVIRNEATLAAIADALKTFGDTRGVQARRADAVGIIADPRFTQELLTQAHTHHLTTPDNATPDNPRPDSASSDGISSGAGSRWGDDDLLDDAVSSWDEPCPDVEAMVPDPLDTASNDPASNDPVAPFDPRDPHLHLDPDDGEPMDAAAQRALHSHLARIKHDAHTNPGSDRGTRVRPGKTEIYVHLTDHTLATGTGVLRAEGLGPMLADQLAELVGHGPYIVKPVIDLNDAVSVDAYEIPDRIRERVKLTHPVEVFPYGTRETIRSMDLDHLRPYDPLGPPGQTSTTNLAPLGRFGHRVKTHAIGWDVRRVDRTTLEWTTPHGFRFHVDPTGTHRVPDP